MKLRNKKTGETMQGLELSVIEYGFGHEWMRDWSYNSIEAFMEDWEDVEENSTAEPLIKDEKIRKAVRAWAEANGYSLVKIGYDMACEPNEGIMQIHFEDAGIVDDDEFGVHTIAELCGEEEE